MSIPGDPDAARALEILALIERQLGDAASRLADAATRAGFAAAQTDWRTDAATVFHASAEAWRREIAVLAYDVENSRHDLGCVRAQLEAEARGWGP